MLKEIFSAGAKSIFSILVITFLTSCAGIVSLEQMRKETENFQLPKTPDEKSAIVYVVRPSMVGTIVRFNVFLDDKEYSSEMGYNRGAQYIYFKVTPGQHRIFSKAENWDEIGIDAQAGRTYFIQQFSKMGIIMARNSLSQTTEDQGKYFVKESELGTIYKTEK